MCIVQTMSCPVDASKAPGYRGGAGGCSPCSRASSHGSTPPPAYAPPAAPPTPAYHAPMPIGPPPHQHQHQQHQQHQQLPPSSLGMHYIPLMINELYRYNLINNDCF